MAKKSTAKRKYRKKAKSTHKSYRLYVLLLAVASLLIVASLLRTIYINRIGSYNSFENEHEQKYPVRGVDVSHHNEYINWSMLIEDNVSFVFMKSTEGTNHIDREYDYSYHLAKEVGLKVGSYHFYTFGEDGVKQAKHFIDNSNIISGDIIPAIDVEHSNINHRITTKESYNKMITELKNLESAIHSHFGVRPFIYTNKECYRLYIKDAFPDNPLWICDLHDEPNDEFDTWQIWQFSHKGSLAGAIGDIDLNFYRGTFDEFYSLLLP